MRVWRREGNLFALIPSDRWKIFVESFFQRAGRSSGCKYLALPSLRVQLLWGDVGLLPSHKRKASKGNRAFQDPRGPIAPTHDKLYRWRCNVLWYPLPPIPPPAVFQAWLPLVPPCLRPWTLLSFCFFSVNETRIELNTSIAWLWHRPEMNGSLEVLDVPLTNLLQNRTFGLGALCGKKQIIVRTLIACVVFFEQGVSYLFNRDSIVFSSVNELRFQLKGFPSQCRP